jgi:O-antigen/teichoic acid export membrane protein
MYEWVITFTAIFLADIFWVLCVKRTHENKAINAGLWSIALFLTTAIGIVSYVHDPWLLIPGALGSFAGVFLTVHWERGQKKSVQTNDS